MLTDQDITELREDPAEPGYVTLDSLAEITTLEENVEVPGVGTFRVTALTMEQSLSMSEAVGVEPDDRAATRAMVMFGVVRPPLHTIEDADRLLAVLLPGQVTVLVEAITRISGMEQDDGDTPGFSEGSPTG